MTYKILDALILDLLDGDIDPASLHYLESELASNPGALARYLSFVDLDVLLQIQSAVEDHLEVPAAFRQKVAIKPKRSIPMIAIFSIAAVLLLIGIVLRLLLVTEDPAFRASNCSTYTLTQSSGKKATKGETLTIGSRLELQQGSVEVTFGSGVRGIIVAPADLTYRDQSLIDLKQGNAWFHVPPAAAGFQVNTARMEVVDLGTEFGIHTGNDDKEEIHVLKGKVSVGTSLGARLSTILKAGDARRIDADGNLVSIPLESGDFIKNLPEKLPHLRWSFDDLSGDCLSISGTFPSSEKINTNTRKTDSTPILVPGKFGMALSLNGRGDYAIADWSGFAGNRPRTVSLWVRLPAPKQNYYKIYSGIVGWGNEMDFTLNSKWKILAVQNVKNGPAFLRLSWGAVWLDGTANLADGRWHHIAVTTTGVTGKTGLPEAELYVNGVREIASYGGNVDLAGSPTMDMDTDTINRKSMPLVIGSDLNPVAENRVYFHGEIDEMMIFDGHMPESDIQKLFHP
ncbi:MAG: hypothetical protein RLZZ245_2527 [Verrucomicrobiota bacterium]|jgi:hypothetical protein